MKFKSTSKTQRTIRLLLATVFLAAGLISLPARAADTVKPTINLLIDGVEDPQSTTVDGASASLTTTVSDDTGVTKVEFYIDDVLYATDTSEPFTANWDVTADNMAQGPHTISALAYDAAGNMGFDEFNETIYNSHANSADCTASPLLICEDFETSAGAANFTTSGGTWTMVGNTYSMSIPATGSTGNANLAVHDTMVPGDFILRTQAIPSQLDGNPDFSVAWGYQNAGNYYYANFSKTNDATQNGIFKVSGGTVTELANFTTTIEDSKWYKVKVEKTGATYRVYRNGVSMGTATDTTHGSGKIGLGSRDNVVNFYPTTLESATPAAYVAPPADNTAPTVAILEPTAGATVTGPVMLKWTHVDNAAGANNAPAIADRQILIDGDPITLNGTDFTTWASTDVPNGPHTINLNAHDAAGNLGTTSITVTVANEGVPPTVSVTAPAAGATIVNNVVLSATASDNVAVTKVEFYVGGILQGTDTTAPYHHTWDSATVPDGFNAVTARAYDAAGNSTVTADRSIKVANNQAPTPVFRLSNYLTQERFFTADVAERDYVLSHYAGWVNEGTAFTAHVMPVPGTTPVYRLANYITQEHLLTADAHERDYAVNNFSGWVYEGVAFYAFPPNWHSGTAVYRLANFLTKERLFTTDIHERDYITAHYPGWVYEGLAFKTP